MRGTYPGDDTTAWLYLLERDETSKLGGTIKIGMTCDPRSRMRVHGQQARFGGGEVIWRHFCTSGSRGLIREIERAAVKALGRAGQQKRPGVCEEFDGISRERAVLIVRETARQVRAHFVGLSAHKARFLAETRAWHDFQRRLYATTAHVGQGS